MPASIETIAIVIAVAFAAGLARGFSGFGSALIFVPLASAQLGPTLAVPLLLVVDAVMTLGLVPPAFRKANKREVLVMSIGAVVGVPVGTYLLATVDPLSIRWAIVVLALVMLGLLISGWKYRSRPKDYLTVLVGGVAGLFSGVAQVGGPPVVAYWLGGAIDRVTVRANIIAYFAVSTVLTAISYLAGGLITSQVLLLALITAPGYGLGVWLGSRMFGLADETLFRRICYVMIALAAITSAPILDGIWR